MESARRNLYPFGQDSYQNKEFLGESSPPLPPRLIQSSAAGLGS